jgi:putative SOS response-associated peptidase YedK
MCNRYAPPRPEDIVQRWQPRQTPVNFPPGPVFPRAAGPFIRRARDSALPERELVVGQWALVPWFAKSAKLPYSTNNARFEELAAKASYKQPWQRGQRCIIPADWFDEPCWESGRNVWWRFRRADGQAWGLAGLWNIWVDRASGEVVESYTMLTLNADSHPLMSRMHKPDPKLAADAQDKRSVVPIDLADVDTWLFGSEAEARQLVRLAEVEVFDTEQPNDAAGLLDLASARR